MSEKSVEESTSVESVQEKKQKPQKFKTIENRQMILKNIMKCQESEREDQVRTKSFEFFDEDLEDSNSKLSEDPEDDSESINVYEMILAMLANIPDRKKPNGQILTQWFLNNFITWMEMKHIEEVLQKEQLTENLQQKALRVCVREPKSSDLLQRIFHVTKESVEEKRDEMINFMFENHQFKEAAELITKNGIIDNFTFEQMVLPLILCDKCQVVDELLKLSKKFQKDYLKFLDYFVGEFDDVVDEFFKPYKEKGLVKINLNRFHGKSLTVFIQKFFNGMVKQFNFDLEERRDAPRFEGFMKRKALKYYYMQRHEDKTMAEEVYFEHVKTTLLQGSKDVVANYLTILWDSMIKERQIEAIFWMKYLNISDDSLKLPPGLRTYIENTDQQMREEADKLFATKTENNGIPEGTEQLFVFEDQQKYPIKIIKTESDLEDLCSELKSVEDGMYIGYDSEFRPAHLVDKNTTKMAIIQLFFNEIAWLIDCIELENQQIRDESWQKFFKCLFQSSKFTVIGFDFRSDLDSLFTIPAINSMFKIEEIQNALCAKKLAEQLININVDILKLSTNKYKLTVLADELLGWKMDKSEQAGNWQCRPLRKNQIVYAAMDAVAVLEIFKKILELTKQFDPPVDIEKLLKESHTVAAKKEKMKKDLKLISSHPWEEIYKMLHTHRDPSKPIQRPSDLKIVVDSMILGLGKNLRLLGIDVYIPRDGDDLNNFIQNMKTLGPNDQRFLVTVPSKSYEMLKAENPELKYIILPNVYNKLPMEIVAEFFDSFNLDIRPEDGLIQSET